MSFPGYVSPSPKKTERISRWNINRAFAFSGCNSFGDHKCNHWKIGITSQIT